MGGTGSGRKFHSGAKNTTDSYRSIDIRKWKKEGLIEPNTSFCSEWTRHGKLKASISVRVKEGYLILNYNTSGSNNCQQTNHAIHLDKTGCHMGGQRVWFLCPNICCNRRVAILYGANHFACRHCYQLAYPSQRESIDIRAANRADKIRDKLGWEPGILNGNGWKPKGMHWSTFDRLTTQHDAYVNLSFSEMEAQLDVQKQRVMNSFDKLK